MLKSFDDLHYGQKLTIAGDPYSSYCGHEATFEAMSTFFGNDVAVVNFLDPKPLAHDGTIVESDLLFLHEIKV